MNDRIVMRTESGVEFEVEPSPLEHRRSVKARAEKSLRESLSGLNEIARDIEAAIRDMDRMPAEVSVTLGVQVSAGANLVIAQAHGAAAMVFEFKFYLDRN